MRSTNLLENKFIRNELIIKYFSFAVYSGYYVTKIILRASYVFEISKIDYDLEEKIYIIPLKFIEYQLEELVNGFSDHLGINNFLKYSIPVISLLIPFCILTMLLLHMRKYQNY